MSKSNCPYCARCSSHVLTSFVVSIDTGVFFFVWGKIGFWWGLVYGAFWPIWIGYRLAEYLWR